MGPEDFDPGGSKPPSSYANRVKISLNKYEKLKRNVLNINMEKKNEHRFVTFNGESVALICESVGVKPGLETEGYQVQYRGKNIIVSVWLKHAISLERFVTEERREFNSDLVIASVRSAVRREVVVLVTGLSFNTPDRQVTEYLEYFGAKMSGGEPIYGVHKDGPWKNQYNGERRYRADFTSQKLPMGTYHLIGGDKVRVVYPGNIRTCGRCHGPPDTCVGAGMAKDCTERGGQRVSLASHMKTLWERIKYEPENEENQYDEDESDEEETSPGSEAPVADRAPQGTEVSNEVTEVCVDKPTEETSASNHQVSNDEEGDILCAEALNSISVGGSVNTDQKGEKVTVIPDMNSQKISPVIQEKLEKFEPENDPTKRKAETSPDLTKKEKKKLRNQEKYQKKKEAFINENIF